MNIPPKIPSYLIIVGFGFWKWSDKGNHFVLITFYYIYFQSFDSYQNTHRKRFEPFSFQSGLINLSKEVKRSGAAAKTHRLPHTTNFHRQIDIINWKFRNRNVHRFVCAVFAEGENEVLDKHTTHCHWWRCLQRTE